MKKPFKVLLWFMGVTPWVFGALVVGLSGYYVHSLPFNWRVDCATGDFTYRILTSTCSAYIEEFYSGDTDEERQTMSANLIRLMGIYDANPGSAIGDRSLALAALFIDRGADVDFVDEYGLTPLHTAVLYAEPKLVDFLLHQGANVDKRTVVGNTGVALSPLEFARKLKTKGDACTGDDWDRVIALLGKQSQEEPQGIGN